VDPRPILAAAFALVLVLAVLTIYVAVRNGPDVLTVLSIVILAMLGFGIFGALREPPR
jgi:sugar phosphate permease